MKRLKCFTRNWKNCRKIRCCGRSGTAPLRRGGGPAAQCSSRIIMDNREYISFASNDYLGLAGHTALAAAAKEAMDRYGFGAGASRLLSGGTLLHRELEERMAEFKQTEAALVFNSGHAANVSAIPALAGEGDVLFSDELNHAGIIDGCRLSRAKKVLYRHRDMDHLSGLLEQEQGKRKIIATDTVFSMDGDIAPLGDIYGICLQHNKRSRGEANTVLYLDDAHGAGVLGNGRGALSHFNIKPEPWPAPAIIQMGTFSKALGSYGAFIAAGKSTIEWLINTGRGFIYSTALPACVIAASLAALSLVQEDQGQGLIKKLWQNRERLFKGLRSLGFNTMDSETPIIPIIPPHLSLNKGAVHDSGVILKLSERLLSRGIYAPAIRPPTVSIPRIRATITAAHTEADIDWLLEALAQTKGKL